MLGLGFFVIPIPQLLYSIQIFLTIFKIVGLPLLIAMLLYSVAPFVRLNNVAGRLGRFSVRGILVLSLVFSLIFVPLGSVNVESARAEVDIEKAKDLVINKLGVEFREREYF